MKHVTRGHDIVADGWAGASNPHPHPDTHPHTNIHNKYQNSCFSAFRLDHYGLTDGPTDKASYRVACQQLKTNEVTKTKDDKEDKEDDKDDNREDDNDKNDGKDENDEDGRDKEDHEEDDHNEIDNEKTFTSEIITTKQS